MTNVYWIIIRCCLWDLKYAGRGCVHVGELKPIQKISKIITRNQTQGLWDDINK